MRNQGKNRFHALRLAARPRFLILRCSFRFTALFGMILGLCFNHYTPSRERQQTENRKAFRMQTKRKSYFDLLRVVGSLAVIALHISNQYFAQTEVLSSAWLTQGVIVTFNRWGVAVFTMLSGALLLPRTLSPKDLLRRAGRLMGTWILWACIFAGFFFINQRPKDRTWETFFSFLLLENHLWYLPMLAGVYLMIPLLQKLTESKRLTSYFLLLWVVFGLALPRCGGFLSLVFPKAVPYWNFLYSSLLIHMPLGYTGYFILGAIFAQTSFTRRAERVIYLAGILSTLYLLGGTILISLRQGSTSSMMYSDLSIPCALQGAAIFLLFRKRLNPRKRSQAFRGLLARLSRWSLCVYLVHPLVLESLRLYTGISAKLFHPLLSIPLIFITVSAVSYLFSAAMDKLLSRVSNYLSPRSKNASA